MSRRLFDVRTTDDEEYSASRWLVWTVGLTVLAAIVWAAYFELDEITRAQGKVIPASREQVVQSLDSGILAELLVREGSRVKEGDVLLRLDDGRSGPVFREAREKQLALQATAARLRAEAQDAPLNFPDDLPAALVQREKQTYAARRRALEESTASMTRSLEALQNEIGITEPLARKGVMSEVELLRLKRQRSDLEGQIAERRNRYATDAANELVRVEAELAQTRENASARKDALTRSVIRAPMAGVVKNVQITTLGGVVQAGMPILEIVPTGDQMLVEAYARPADVAFLSVGQAATVKLTAYDFNRFGGLQGQVVHISPGTLREDRQRRPGTPVELEEGLYRLMVKITDQNLQRHGLRMEPLPGMTAMVEIRTGEKTVLEYLIRPLQSVSQALRER